MGTEEHGGGGRARLGGGRHCGESERPTGASTRSQPGSWDDSGGGEGYERAAIQIDHSAQHSITSQVRWPIATTLQNHFVKYKPTCYSNSCDPQTESCHGGLLEKCRVSFHAKFLDHLPAALLFSSGDGNRVSLRTDIEKCRTYSPTKRTRSPGGR